MSRRPLADISNAASSKQNASRASASTDRQLPHRSKRVRTVSENDEWDEPTDDQPVQVDVGHSRVVWDPARLREQILSSLRQSIRRDIEEFLRTPDREIG